MTDSIEGKIFSATGLLPVLEEIANLSDRRDGILKIDDGQITYQIAFSAGQFITGALSSTDIKGRDALRSALAVREGTFHFFYSQLDRDLQQPIRIEVSKLVGAMSSPGGALSSTRLLEDNDVPTLLTSFSSTAGQQAVADYARQETASGSDSAIEGSTKGSEEGHDVTSSSRIPNVLSKSKEMARRASRESLQKSSTLRLGASAGRQEQRGSASASAEDAPSETPAEEIKALKTKSPSRAANPLWWFGRRGPTDDSAKRNDLGSTMRLKFHEKAPQPTLENLWTAHHDKVRFACLIVAAIALLSILGRTLVCTTYSQKAQKAVKKRDWQTALQESEKALSLDPNFESARMYKGTALAGLDDYQGALSQYDFVLEHNPKNVDALYRREATNLRLGNYKQALDDANKLLALRPDTKLAYVFANRAAANYMLGEMQGAVRDYTKAIALSTPSPLLLGARAHAYHDLGQWDKAHQDYDSAIRLSPKDPDLYIARAENWHSAKKEDKALADFAQALAISPASPKVLTERGAYFAKVKQYDKALADFKQALSINPKYVDAIRNRARLQAMRHQYQQALSDMDQVARLQAPDYHFYLERGDLHYQIGNLKNALEDYTLAITKQPGDVTSYTKRAQCYARLHNLRQAIADIDSALKLIPPDSHLYALRGYYGWQYGNSASARADLDKAIALDPRNTEAHLWRGEFFLQDKKYISATEDFDAALRQNPNLAEALHQKAIAQAALRRGMSQPLAVQAPAEAPSMIPSAADQKLIDGGSFQQLLAAGYSNLSKGNLKFAIVLLQKAVRLEPNNPVGRRYLAHALLTAGDTRDAIEQFQTVLSLDQNDPTDTKSLADALTHENRLKEAIDAYVKCLAVNPHDIQASCALAHAYAASGNISKAKEVCIEGIKNANGAAELNTFKSLLTEIDGKGRGGDKKEEQKKPDISG